MERHTEKTKRNVQKTEGERVVEERWEEDRKQMERGWKKGKCSG